MIGRGGMGEVYLGADTRLGRSVAIKVSSREFNDRFEREARAISTLSKSCPRSHNRTGPQERLHSAPRAARQLRGLRDGVDLVPDSALEYIGAPWRTASGVGRITVGLRKSDRCQEFHLIRDGG